MGSIKGLGFRVSKVRGTLFSGPYNKDATI